MAIDIEKFWGSNYYEHPKLTDEMIVFAEQALKVKLPEEFIRLLKIQNGGYTKGFVYPMSQPTSWADDHIPFRELFGIVIDQSISTAQNILDTAYMTEEWELPEKQVLLLGEGHWWITLDYRNGPIPKVMWIDVDCEEEVEIAENFAKLLEGLVPKQEFEKNQS